MSRILKPRPLTREAFRRFGDVIEARASDAPREINQGYGLRFDDLAQVHAGDGRAIVSIFRSKPSALPFAIRTMERHPLGSQAFVPLSGRPYLVVVAPAGPFDMNAVEAFVASERQGVNFRPGVWHHFNLALVEESEFLVIDRDGPGDNLEEVFWSEAEAPILVAPDALP